MVYNVNLCVNLCKQIGVLATLFCSKISMISHSRYPPFFSFEYTAVHSSLHCKTNTSFPYTLCVRTRVRTHDVTGNDSLSDPAQHDVIYIRKNC